jgi:hypothetical protein
MSMPFLPVFVGAVGIVVPIPLASENKINDHN